MDIPLIRNFAYGYEQGVKHVNPRRRGDRQLYRHHARRLERSGARRRARDRPVRPGCRRGLRRRRRHRPRRAAGGGRQGQALDRRRQQPEPPASRQRADLDAQAGRRRGLQRLQERQGRHLAGRRAEPRPEGGRRRLRARRQQPRSCSRPRCRPSSTRPRPRSSPAARGQGLLLDRSSERRCAPSEPQLPASALPAGGRAARHRQALRRRSTPTATSTSSSRPAPSTASSARTAPASRR